MGRSGVAKLFSFTDSGQLGSGAVAEIAVYKPDKDVTGMFRCPTHVNIDGE